MLNHSEILLLQSSYLDCLEKRERERCNDSLLVFLIMTEDKALHCLCFFLCKPKAYCLSLTTSQGTVVWIDNTMTALDSLSII